MPDLHRTIVENLSDGVYYVDRRRRITFWNRGAERLTGFTSDEVLGRRCRDGILMHADGSGNILCGSRCPLLHTMRDGEPRECNVFLHHRDGHRKPVSIRAAPIRDDDGKIVGAVEIFNDDSEATAIRHRLHDLERQALADETTGIGNRRFLENAIRGRLDELGRYGWPFGVLFADIDGFKAVNDRFGHGIGDEVLRMVATTLSYAARASDSVGRWGGEEFVVVVPNAEARTLRVIADRMRALVERSILPHATQPFGVTVSIGGTIAGEDDTPEGVVARADRLMYESKAAGRNCVTIG